VRRFSTARLRPRKWKFHEQVSRRRFKSDTGLAASFCDVRQKGLGLIPQPTVREILRRAAERTLAYDLTVWFWGDAIAVDGLLDAAELLDDPRLLHHCHKYYERWVRRQLAWTDHLTPGLGLLRLHKANGNPSLLEGALRLAHWLNEEVPRDPRTGAPLYRPDLPAYRHTVWVDALYHEPSFFAQLARQTGDLRYYDDALDVWHGHARVLSSKQGPFLAHAYDCGALLLRGFGWGRGNGWALFGMIDTLELLPFDHPKRPDALRCFLNLSAAVRERQDASGFWRTLLDDSAAYLESSTAAFFGAAFTKAVRLGLLGPEYAEAADRAWDAALSRIDENGGFYGVSACTHAAVFPGDDAPLYRTLPTEVNLWGQGSVLRFAAERLRAGFT
jgi:unsaturated rhamnogalacturonyl hydrolase